MISTSTGSVVADIDLGYAFNTRIRVSPDGQYAYVVSSEEGHVIQIDCLSRTVSGSIFSGSPSRCLDLYLNNQGTELYALSRGEFYVVDTLDYHSWVQRQAMNCGSCTSTHVIAVC